MNSIHVIQPYWHHGTWVLMTTGTVSPVSLSSPGQIRSLEASRVAADARSGFKLLFAEFRFPGAQLEVTRTSEGDGQSGTYYRAEQTRWMEALPRAPALLS
jgi:hypothetical protein